MPFRSLQRPLTPDQLRPLEPGLTRLQFSAGLTDEEYRAVARLLEPRPDVTLRAYGGYGWTLQDLEWLRWFPGLRRVAIDALWGVLRDPDGLRFLPDDLEELGLGKVKPPFDLRTIARFRSLRRLGLGGPVRHAEAISAFTELEALLLRSVTLPDLSPLRSMRALRRLDLKLGGTSDLRLLPEVGRIEELEIWHVRGLADLAPISEVRSLRTLWLEALPQVRSLPDLSGLTELRGVTIHTMKGIHDLTPLASAPALEDLALIAMPHHRARRSPSARRASDTQAWPLEHRHAPRHVRGARRRAGRARALRLCRVAGGRAIPRPSDRVHGRPSHWPRRG